MRIPRVWFRVVVDYDPDLIPVNFGLGHRMTSRATERFFLRPLLLSSFMFAFACGRLRSRRARSGTWPFLGYQDRLSIPDPDHDLAKEVPVLMFPVPPTAMTRMTCSLPGKIDSR